MEVYECQCWCVVHVDVRKLEDPELPNSASEERILVAGLYATSLARLGRCPLMDDLASSPCSVTEEDSSTAARPVDPDTENAFHARR